MDKALLHLIRAQNVNQLASIGKKLAEKDAGINFTDSTLCLSAAMMLHKESQKDLHHAVYNYFSKDD